MCITPGTLQRHTLVWITEAAWQNAYAGLPAATPADWVARQWPLIVRRRTMDDPADAVPVGLPLPPSSGKLKLAFSVPDTAILRHSKPLLLSEVQHKVPEHWRHTVKQLINATPHTRVFGSLAWSALTSLDYLSTSSDLDLIFDLSQDWPHDTAALQHIAASAPMRIDAEFVRQDGWAVNWRELHSESSHLLIKTSGAPMLVTREAFLTELGS